MTRVGSQNVFISGASRGIGEKTALFFLRKGWTVVSVSHSKPGIRHPGFIWERCDIANPRAVTRVIGTIKRRFDCVVHNAAQGGPVGRSLDVPLGEWRAVFETNFFSHLNITRQIVRHCRRGASFIFFSGGGAVTPRANLGPYAMSKLAIVKLVEQLSLEEKRFRFYAIAPGTHETRMLRRLFSRLQEVPHETTEFQVVERLLDTLIRDRSARLSGRLLHVRDDLEALVTLKDGGYVRRVEQR